MKIIFTSFDKAAITNLPRVLFPGKIVVVDKPEDTETAVNDLLSHYILGVDTETRPSFKRGQAYHVSLLQVSTHDTCYLFRLHHTGMTPAIIRLLEDTNFGIADMSLQKLSAETVCEPVSPENQQGATVEQLGG